MERTEISSLGEFGLIDHLTQNNETRNASTILSVGDDAAVIDHFGRQTVNSSKLSNANLLLKPILNTICVGVAFIA